jgi:hypothetical protein
MQYKLKLQDLQDFENLARTYLLETPASFRFEDMTRRFTAVEARMLAFIFASIAFYKARGVISADADPFAIELEEADSAGIDHHDWTDSD